MLELLLLLFEEETGASNVSFGHIGSFRRVEQSGQQVLLLSTGVYGWDLWSAHHQVSVGLPKYVVYLQECIVLAQVPSLFIDIGGAPAGLDSSTHELRVDSSKVFVSNLGAEVVTRATFHSELMLDDVLSLTQVFDTRFAFNMSCLGRNKLLLVLLRVLVMHQLNTVISLDSV